MPLVCHFIVRFNQRQREVKMPGLDAGASLLECFLGVGGGPQQGLSTKATLPRAWAYVFEWMQRLGLDLCVCFVYCCCSVAESCLTLQPHGLQHARLPCPALSPGVCSNLYPLSHWCYPTISSSVVPFSSCPQSFPASGSFPMSQFFDSGGQRIGISASATVLPMNIQDSFHLGFPGLISLQSKGLSRVFPNTTVQKRQFFSTQLSLWSNSHIHTWLLGKP